MPIPSSSGESAEVKANSPANHSLLKTGDVFAGKFRVARFLGTGSLCATYLGYDHKAGEQRVLKILKPAKASNPLISNDFLFLARSVAQYRYPGIARIFESGFADGETYYIMEKIEGQPLRAWFLENLTFSNRIFPGLEILRGLIAVFKEIQERGCYGVLKPENVFLDKTRGPVVMDFGVPGFLGTHEFEMNAYAHRYMPYMAPELRNEWSNLLPQSDIFSLGAILYEILVGRVPASPFKILPTEASSYFSIAVDDLVLQATDVDPFRRFASLKLFDEAVVKIEQELKSIAGRATSVIDAQPDSTEPGTRELSAANATDVIPVSPISPETGSGFLGKDTEALLRAQTNSGTEVLSTDPIPLENSTATETEELDLHSRAARIIPGGETGKDPEAEGENLEDSETAISKQDIGHLLLSKKELEEEVAEEIPILIWILVGVLAVAFCVLAAMLGGLHSF